ncbi:MAG: translocation/assembly module TamB, partial [Muribaculaceae bacterium]|nr:translocation/assembly module TamB [Muribaculaceae bacterium]
LNLCVLDPMATIISEWNAELTPEKKHISASVDVENFSPEKLLLIDNYRDYNLKAALSSNIEFSSIDDITGYLTLTDLDFIDDKPATPDLTIKSFTIESAPVDDDPALTIQSDFINATLDGNYRFTSLYSDLKDMAEMIFPSIKSSVRQQPIQTRSKLLTNNFTYHIDINECENLCKFFNLPISVIYPIELDGHISEINSSASLTLNAPYILQGDKIIENTTLNAEMNGSRNSASVNFTTKMPTKKGPMTAFAELTASSDRIDNNIKWNIDRKIPINGSFNFTTNLFRNFDNTLATSITFHPGTINFGNDIWSINPSTISLSQNKYEIQNFALTSEDKAIAINGIVSDSPDESIHITLSKIALLDIFETLEIDKALIGGIATGDFSGNALLSSQPMIYSDNLHVDNISYNRCVLGDADIKANWDNDKKSFYLDADVIGNGGLHSYIKGDIYPEGEALDINFDANHIPVGFMKPFMEAFASDLNGFASGKARLFGTFKYIDLEGDVFADNLNIKIAFTNTWYSASDSIRLRPGIIDVDNVTIRDINGNTAMLNGVVRHTFFKEPSFNFTVSDAHDFLSYDVDSRLSPDWYGTIYGNGGATITGEPGVVNIGVNMSTAPKSSFTFVLSDRLDADEYSFITFKDSRAEARRDSLMKADNVPTVVRLLRERLGVENNNSTSAYNMDLQIGVTPEARITLVMDPVSGDEIKATGAGNLRMTYGSLNNDLKMYGTYTLNHGSYNFTLQDIIIKDFTIKEGSSIAFHGDPYSAQLDIEAIYAVNANLSDLDESFLLDKDLNRTNVPVHALLKVTGDMRQPDIDFDLEFPTLTQDTYRKVRSIVSTKEMMNRQIIYLLALNRFYTPDYMASTTKGNELFSVASSTISSQLSSMLGKLSDDWSIAPNLRSDRGDFSDVEVDVALSSR